MKSASRHGGRLFAIDGPPAGWSAALLIGASLPSQTEANPRDAPRAESHLPTASLLPPFVPSSHSRFLRPGSLVNMRASCGAAAAAAEGFHATVSAPPAQWIAADQPLSFKVLPPYLSQDLPRALVSQSAIENSDLAPVSFVSSAGMSFLCSRLISATDAPSLQATSHSLLSSASRHFDPRSRLSPV